MTNRLSIACSSQQGRRNPRTFSRTSKGFSLIEVLVAIVILAFGMLGTVGMQAFALRANRDARLQAQATLLARELAEMMRGNKVVGSDPSATNNFYLGTFAVGGLTMGANAAYCSGV